MKKYKRFFRIIPLFLFLFFTAFLCSDLLFYSPIIISGVLLNGLLGKVRNKVGGAVFFNWKTINAVRSFSKPSNPQSEDQTTQRTRYARIVFIARQILGDVIKPFWNPFYFNYSGYNAFVKYNIMQLSSTMYNLTTSNLMCRGNLLTPEIDECELDEELGDFHLTWYNINNGSTSLPTDSIQVVIFSLNGNLIYSSYNTLTRDDAGLDVNIGLDLEASNLIVYIFATRINYFWKLVSNSDSQIPGAA